jgi:hypothetical protein
MSGMFEIELVTGLTMRPQRQTIHGSPYNVSSFTPEGVGNCYSACIASLIGCPIDDVPHIQFERNLAEYLAGIELPWHDRRIAREWLRREHELDLAVVDTAEAIRFDVHYIATVRSHRGPWNHAVIAHRGDVVFDPSGLDDYTAADFTDDNVEAVTLPYEPDPPTLIAMWIAHYTEAAA